MSEDSVKVLSDNENDCTDPGTEAAVEPSSSSSSRKSSSSSSSDDESKKETSGSPTEEVIKIKSNIPSSAGASIKEEGKELQLLDEEDSLEVQLVPDSKSTRIFQFKSISASILRSLNMFRENYKKKALMEDVQLMRIAMEHSKKAAEKNDTVMSTDGISKAVKDLPLIFFESHVNHQSTMDNAFTTVVNTWTTEPCLASSLQKDWNAAGVGTYISSREEVYFTLILGLRSTIGNSHYRGASLRSVLLAEQCYDLINQIRTKDFDKPLFGLSHELCDLAFEYCGMLEKNGTKDTYITDKLKNVSSYMIGQGSVKEKTASPKTIVEDWMNQMSKTKTVLGDYNRVGFGFVKKKDRLDSVSIYVRAMSAAVIDGTETIIDGTIIGRQIAEMLNEFREQHSLEPLNIDPDLCEVAQEHTEYVANGQVGISPLEGDFYVSDVEPNYAATDISHLCCNEISRAPKVLMARWRNNPDCISVLLNQVDDIGVGVCFNEFYVCHITVIIASKGNASQLTNKIVKL